MKKHYTTPNVEMQLFAVEDVLTASGVGEGSTQINVNTDFGDVWGGIE